MSPSPAVDGPALINLCPDTDVPLVRNGDTSISGRFESVRLTLQLATTEKFTDHAAVADGASDLFAQIFGADNGHTRVVYGVQSLPKGTPVVTETIFEIAS